MLVKVDKENLKSIRTAQGYSKHKLSIESGLGKNAIQKMESENGKSSLLRVKAIASVLNINPDLLIKKE